MEYKKVTFNGKNYCVFIITNNVPVVVDWNDFKIIYNLNKPWTQTNDSYICNDSCYLHEIIMALKSSDSMEDLDKFQFHTNIKHLNNIGIDNRRDNLLLKSDEISYSDNNKSDILPKYVSYVKPHGSHGERFVVTIGDLVWKTTSSKKASYRYKLEEAKKYLRELKHKKPELFYEDSDVYKIIKKAGYEYQLNDCDNNLEQIDDDLSSFEKKLLKTSKLLDVKRKKILFSKLPKSSGIKQSDIPEYCYYREATVTRGDHFIIEGHPELSKKWQTTTSKLISTQDKYSHMIAKIQELNHPKPDCQQVLMADM
jgi:hypothetical protein